MVLLDVFSKKLKSKNSLNLQTQTKKGFKTLQKFISFNVDWIGLLDLSPKLSKSNKNNISSGKKGFSELIWKFLVDFWKVYNLLSWL